MRTEYNEGPVPAGDYPVRFHGKYATNTTYVILVGEYKGRFLYVPNHLIPDIILTVTVEEKLTTTTRNVARFKSEREGTISPREAADGWLA